MKATNFINLLQRTFLKSLDVNSQDNPENVTRTKNSHNKKANLLSRHIDVILMVV